MLALFVVNVAVWGAFGVAVVRGELRRRRQRRGRILNPHAVDVLLERQRRERELDRGGPWRPR